MEKLDPDLNLDRFPELFIAAAWIQTDSRYETCVRFKFQAKLNSHLHWFHLRNLLWRLQVWLIVRKPSEAAHFCLLFSYFEYLARTSADQSAAAASRSKVQQVKLTCFFICWWISHNMEAGATPGIPAGWFRRLDSIPCGSVKLDGKLFVFVNTVRADESRSSSEICAPLKAETPAKTKKNKSYKCKIMSWVSVSGASLKLPGFLKRFPGSSLTLRHES